MLRVPLLRIQAAPADSAAERCGREGVPLGRGTQRQQVHVSPHSLWVHYDGHHACFVDTDLRAVLPAAGYLVGNDYRGSVAAGRFRDTAADLKLLQAGFHGGRGYLARQFDAAAFGEQRR